MNELEAIVARQALEQSLHALKHVPADASVNLRCNVITTAVRALSAFREIHHQSPQQDRPSPA